MTKKYRDIHAKFVHKTAQGFFESGLITKERMKEYDESCLVKEKKQKIQTHETAKQVQLEKAS